MQKLIDEFLSPKRFAIVGASDNPQKYGHRIIHDLKDRGYEVYPINPRLKEIDGMECYPTLADTPVKIDVVDIAAPPQVTEKVVQECKALGLERIWIQPGAESERAISFCMANNLQVVYNVCVMMSTPQDNKTDQGEP